MHLLAHILCIMSKRFDDEAPNSLGRAISVAMRERGLSMSELGRRAGLSRGYLYTLFNSPDRSPRHATLIAIANALEVPVTRLMESAGTMVPGAPAIDTMTVSQWPRDLPVYGTSPEPSSRNGAIFSLNVGKVSDWASRPPVLNGILDAYAIYVSGASMVPMLPDGEVAVIHPGKPVRDGDVALLRFVGGNSGYERAGIGIMRKNTNDGRISLEALNGLHTHATNHDIASLHRVLTFTEILGL